MTEQISEAPQHELDDHGNEIHIDVDPQIPTGICAICSWAPEPPRDEYDESPAPDDETPEDAPEEEVTPEP